MVEKTRSLITFKLEPQSVTDIWETEKILLTVLILTRRWKSIKKID